MLIQETIKWEFHNPHQHKLIYNLTITKEILNQKVSNEFFSGWKEIIKGKVPLWEDMILDPFE